MQFSTELEHIVRFALMACLTMGSLTSCVIVGKLDEAVDSAQVIRKIRIKPARSKKIPTPALPSISSKKLIVPLDNAEVPQTITIKKVWKSTYDVVAVLDTINNGYQIYVDCHAGIIYPANVMLPVEKTSLIANVCKSAKAQIGGTEDENFDQIVKLSYQLSFGREPSQDEMSYWLRYNEQELTSMNTLMFYCQAWLKDSADLNETIIRAYELVLQRYPTDDEISYWQQRIRTENLIYVDLLPLYKSWKQQGNT